MSKTRFTLTLNKPSCPLYRVYAASSDPGALLVRIGHGTQHLKKALRRATQQRDAVSIELRRLWNGREELVEVWNHGKALFNQLEIRL